MEIQMNELAGQSLGGYQLEQEIGHGSMGVVYRGKQIALGREVAIKVLPKTLARDASYVARFIREAQIIAGLNHPNIVQIYDAGQQNKLLYFVMEYVQGPTLSSLLHLDGTIAQHMAVEYASQIADALDAAYKERNVIHRDVKPENLMLNRWGKIKVMDFGLARATGHQKITVAKTLVGSIYYASPEQIWGETLDNRSDIYALGVVLYEMVTGQRPFNGRSMPELTQAIIQGNPQPPSTYNSAIVPELEYIILKALSLHRQQRYADASQMAQELQKLHLQPIEPSSSSLPLTPRPGTNRPAMQPPKRPQIQRPRYLDVDLQQTLPPPAEPMTPPIQPIFQEHQHQQANAKKKTAMSSMEPAHYQHMSPSPRTPLPEDIKTVSLESLEKRQGREKPRRSFWGQLQKLFKLPS
jgi:serine/threonine protein kinase